MWYCMYWDYVMAKQCCFEKDIIARHKLEVPI